MDKPHHTFAPVVLAAGGTGGHIFPAESLAETLRARGIAVELITDKRFLQYNPTGYHGVFGDIPIHTIQAGSPTGGNLFAKLRASLRILLGIWQARCVLKQLQPRVVVGFGGYPSFPSMLAASRLGIPTLIHEQNSVLGRANRVLAERVTAIATTYVDTRHVPANARTVHTGNPVRAAVSALAHIPYSELSEEGAMRILVLGGSQGATVLSEVVPQAIALLPEHLRQRLRIDQQCRAADLDRTREAYRALNISADLAVFFTDIPARLGAAHLVVSRAGASTVAELAAAGRPAILVPYPQAADNHQYFNAQAVEEANAGWLMAQDAFTPQALAARLESFLTLPSTLLKAATNMRGLGKIKAADDLADKVLSLTRGSCVEPSLLPPPIKRAA